MIVVSSNDFFRDYGISIPINITEILANSICFDPGRNFHSKIFDLRVGMTLIFKIQNFSYINWNSIPLTRVGHRIVFLTSALGL